jgi:hypothetical protein
LEGIKYSLYQRHAPLICSPVSDHALLQTCDFKVICA